jgi:hypothetical protein
MFDGSGGYLIKEEETNPNRMKIHWKTIAKI